MRATAPISDRERKVYPMPIRVYDYRTDIANLVVHPAIRGRFMRMEPAPAGHMHSHDLGGEIFLVLEGQCEFLVEDDRVTCGPGQLIYVEPPLKHTLHAVGDGPCIVYLSVTPHVEPTHTRYDADYRTLPPEYGAWRGKVGDPQPEVETAELVRRYVASARRLADLACANAEAAESRLDALVRAESGGDQTTAKAEMDTLWLSLRDALWQVDTLEKHWNAVTPRGMPKK